VSNQPPPPPGWYPDQSGKGQRYWDGKNWGPAAPAPARPKSRFPTWAVVLGVLLLCPGSCGVFGLIGALSSHNSTQNSQQSSTRAAPVPGFTAAPTTERPLPGIGQQARDGKFAFTVTSVDRSQVAGDPTNPFLQTTAKGEFINVHLKVANIGNQAQTFFATNQKLIAGGQQFEADTMAAVGVGGANQDINPGLSIETVASFDVPPGTVPGVLEVHDSMFSGGAKIRLQG
jgi:hypothetical protein